MAIPKLKGGLFGIGLATYWSQFKGLKPRLEKYVRAVEQKLAQPSVEVVNLGLIDNPKSALEAGHKFRAADVDLIFLHVTTYALSSAVLPVVQRAKVPVIVSGPRRWAISARSSALTAISARSSRCGRWSAPRAVCANTIPPRGREWPGASPV